MLFDGEWCSVTAFDGPSVRLRSADGRALVLLISELLATAGCKVAGTPGAEIRQGLSAALTIADGLPEGLRSRANAMLADLLEARTGFRSGSAEEPLPGEPRPAYDPAPRP